MDHRVRKGARAAFLLALAFSLTATQVPPGATTQPKPECDPHYQAEYEAATGKKPEGCAPPAATGTQPSTTPSEGQLTVDSSSVESYQEDGESDGDSPDRGNDNWWKWLLGGAVAVGSVVAIDQMTSKDWLRPEDLDRNGPRFSDRRKVGHYQIQGYAAAGWPFAIDLDTQPGTRTWLEVRYQGSDKKEVVDLTFPEGGRRMKVVTLPGAPGGIAVARYSIRSGLPRGRHKPLYRDFKIYGIGAGPNAVGSLYLKVTDFSPARAIGPSQVSWAVSAERGFQKSLLEVLRVPGPGEKKYTLVTSADIPLRSKIQRTGSWGSFPMRGRIGAGRYEMQVRAWREGDAGGDWTGAYAPNQVTIP